MISRHLEAVSSQHLGGAASVLLPGLQYSLLPHASWTQHRHDYHSGLKAFSLLDQKQQWVSESQRLTNYFGCPTFSNAILLTILYICGHNNRLAAYACRATGR